MVTLLLEAWFQTKDLPLILFLFLAALKFVVELYCYGDS